MRIKALTKDNVLLAERKCEVTRISIQNGCIAVWVKGMKEPLIRWVGLHNLHSLEIGNFKLSQDGYPFYTMDPPYEVKHD